MQEGSVLLRGQWTLTACDTLLAFSFQVLGLGRGLKSWSKSGIYASIFMGSCSTVLSGLMVSSPETGPPVDAPLHLNYFYFNLNFPWCFTVSDNLPRENTQGSSTHLQSWCLLTEQAVLDKLVRGLEPVLHARSLAVHGPGVCQPMVLPMSLTPRRRKPKSSVEVRDSAWNGDKELAHLVKANPSWNGLSQP